MKSKPSKKTLVLPCLALVPCVPAGCAFLSPHMAKSHVQSVDPPMGSAKNPHVDTPEETRRRALYQGRLEAFESATSRKDFEAAERELRAARAIDARDPFFDLNFARLYDAQGRLREAMDAYASALGPHSRAVSSIQDDPRLLARFGELCLAFGRRREARAAFLKAVPPYEPRRMSDAISPQGRVVPDPSYVSVGPSSSDGPLRSAAHLAAAARFASQGQDGRAASEAALAMRADPSSWAASLHLAEVRARSGDRRGARAAFAAAERLAKGAAKGAVASARDQAGLSDSVTVVTIRPDGTSAVSQRPKTAAEMREYP